MSNKIMKPWQRLPNETDKAFSAFQIYMNLPVSGRSIDEAWRVYSGGKKVTSGRHPTYFYKWSTGNNWVNRASAHDDYLSQQLQQKLDADILADRETQYKTYLALRSTALQALKKIDPSDVNFAQITQAVKMANEGIKQLLGDTAPDTSITINNSVGVDLSKFDEVWSAHADE